ncbi:MAG: response regulator transcription factor [Herminiimonas sp.]|uniref:response regulator transcription factor n=1 Tax=Herminiimonas sp. TaxID=1926289 RepID=UPI00271B558A|nr:response regulator transcription factor [Herminiimonas sp.]MDO9419268.1 response regulator transcription factor [Herminiimonas sp.]
MKIAILDDDPIESKFIHRILTAAGHECTTFLNSNALFAALHHQIFGLLILDWHLPDMAGKDVVECVRNNFGEEIAVMFLSKSMCEENIVIGLMAGADDYMIKPIRVAELIARIHALSKRMRLTGGRVDTVIPLPNVMRVGLYQFDLVKKIAILRSEPVELKPKEFDVAVLLFQNIGKLVSRERFMQEVWGRELMMASRTLDTHISRVRVMLQIKSDNNVRLSTVYTVGYRLDAI